MSANRHIYKVHLVRLNEYIGGNFKTKLEAETWVKKHKLDLVDGKPAFKDKNGAPMYLQYENHKIVCKNKK